MTIRIRADRQSTSTISSPAAQRAGLDGSAFLRLFWAAILGMCLIMVGRVYQSGSEIQPLAAARLQQPVVAAPEPPKTLPPAQTPAVVMARASAPQQPASPQQPKAMDFTTGAVLGGNPPLIPTRSVQVVSIPVANATSVPASTPSPSPPQAAPPQVLAAVSAPVASPNTEQASEPTSPSSAAAPRHDAPAVQVRGSARSDATEKSEAPRASHRRLRVASAAPAGGPRCTRYRTYNAQTHTYRSYDGKVMACR